MKMKLRLLYREKWLSQIRWASAATSANNIQADDSLTTGHNAKLKSYYDIPSPGGHFLIRALKNFTPFIGKYGNDLHAANVGLYEEMGPIVREKILHMNLLHLFDPNDFQAYFRNEDKLPVRPPLMSFRKIRLSRPDLYKSGGLLTVDGEDWYQLRRKFQQEMMRPRNVEHYIPTMDVVAGDFLNRMELLKDKKGEIPDFLNEIYKWALETVGLVVFNTRLGCLENNLPEDSEAQKVIKAVYDTFDALHKLELISLRRLLKMDDPKAYNQLERAQEFIALTAAKYVNKTMDWLKNSDPDDSSRETTLLAAFLLKKDVEEQDIISLINDVLFAAVDTTSHSIGFVLYNLCRNPHAQQKMYEEAAKTEGDGVTQSTLNELRYMKACVKESMRLYPIVGTNSRVIQKPTVIRDYLVPPGVFILFHHRVVCTLSSNFENPMEFRPERWMKENKEEQNIHPFASLPFGHGTRSCIGRRLAEQEMLLLLRRIILKYRVEYHYEDLKTKIMLINRPASPLRVTFIERQKSK